MTQYNSVEDRLRASDAEVLAIGERRAAEALRVTAGYTVEELKAMPDQALGRARHLLEGFLEVLEHNDPWTKTTRKNAIASIRAALAKAAPHD